MAYTEYVQHSKLKLRTFMAENLFDHGGQRSSSVGLTKRGELVLGRSHSRHLYWTRNGAMGCCVPTKCRGLCKKRISKNMKLVQLKEPSSFFNIKILPYSWSFGLKESRPNTESISWLCRRHSLTFIPLPLTEDDT